MEMDWKLDNPSSALANYYSNYDTFVSKKSELESKQAKLDGMGEYIKADVDLQIKKIKEDTQQKISKAQREFDSEKAALSSKKDENIQTNDIWLSERLKQLLGDNGDVKLELSEEEQKALEFEISRRKFVTTSNEKINNYQDGITQEKLECKTIVGQWKQEQDDISSKYAPDILKYKKICDDINRKHQPDIRQFQNLVSEKVSDRDEEIGQLQSERKREIQLADYEIVGYQRDYKQTEKQFGEQIRMAKLQNKPTTRMENSRVSRLNSINDQIQILKAII